MPTPTCEGLGETLCATERSTSFGPTTWSVACAECARLPLVALKVRGNEPFGAEALVLTVTVAVFGVASLRSTVVGWMVAEVFAGNPPRLKATCPVKPLVGVT